MTTTAATLPWPYMAFTGGAHRRVGNLFVNNGSSHSFQALFPLNLMNLVRNPLPWEAM
jgi:hypothetical protein